MKKETEEKWLKEVKQEEKGEAFIPWDENSKLPEPTQEAIEKKAEQIKKEKEEGEEGKEEVKKVMEEEEVEKATVAETDLEELDW